MMTGERADSAASDDAGAHDGPTPRPSSPQSSAPRSSGGAVAAAASALTGRSGVADPDDDAKRRTARGDAWRGLDQGSIMSVELLTATLVWFGIGWLVDQALGTMPWFMFAGALLGNWVGLYLLWLRGQRAEVAAKEGARPTPADSEQRADR